jgi:malonyl-CoA decarboxylase
MRELCEALLTGRGEASGVALAQEILNRWRAMAPEERRQFLLMLAQSFDADRETVDRAIRDYLNDPGPTTLLGLHNAAEPRRQEVIRRLNLAPGGVEALVRMREDLFRWQRSNPDLNALDADFVHLFTSWFNRGFLELRRIDWATPANILEKIIEYEAVHTISDWDELRRRLAPPDRRLYAFFHPQLRDEPLIFVEVALTAEIPSSIGSLLTEERDPIAPEEANTAVFYSISNCQDGLRGISFGNFLIKQVVEELRRELPRLTNFVTLSPAPGFAAWLARERQAEGSVALTAEDKAALEMLARPDWHRDPDAVEALQEVLCAAAAYYFLRVKNARGRPLDPVARFHLGSGARLERLNLLGDLSSRGLDQAHGLMVNYLYKLDAIEANHEAYAARGDVVAAPAVRRLLRASALREGAPPVVSRWMNSPESSPAPS